MLCLPFTLQVITCLQISHSLTPRPPPNTQVDRAHYATMSPYQDSPQSIGHGATISAPHMHAAAVESLLPHLLPDQPGPSPSPPRRVLDVGSGSGYLTHVLAELVGEGGLVVGVEHISALRDLGDANMRASARGRDLLAAGRVRFVVGDGRKGWVEEEDGAGAGAGAGAGGEGSWDAIHVGASAVRVHEELVRQLRAPGRLFIPVDDDEDGGGSGGQHIWTVDKDAEGRVTRKKLFGVRYVPLTDKPRS